jgi:hypothetical protein
MVQNMQLSRWPPFWATFITMITSAKTYVSSQKILWPLVPKRSVSGHGCIIIKCDQIEPIYLPQSFATYIYLHLYIRKAMKDINKRLITISYWMLLNLKKLFMGVVWMRYGTSETAGFHVCSCSYTWCSSCVNDVGRYVIIRNLQEYRPIFKICSVFTYSFIHQLLYSRLLGPCHFLFQFRDHTHIR